MTELNNVPAAQVGQKVQQLVNAGSKHIECTQQANGLWTIIDHG